MSYISDGVAPQVEKIIREVAKAYEIPVPLMGTEHPDIVDVLAHHEKLEPNASSGPKDPTDPQKTMGIVVSEGLEDLVTEDELRGMIAHEMGHIKNGDTFRRMALSRTTELEADELAAEHGFGKPLASALKKLDAEPSHAMPKFNGKTVAAVLWDHPSLEDRLSAIRTHEPAKSSGKKRK